MAYPNRLHTFCHEALWHISWESTLLIFYFTLEFVKVWSFSWSLRSVVFSTVRPKQIVIVFLDGV